MTPARRVARAATLLLLATPLLVLLIVATAGPARADNCDPTLNPGDCENTAWTVGAVAATAAAATAAAVAAGVAGGGSSGGTTEGEAEPASGAESEGEGEDTTAEPAEPAVPTLILSGPDAIRVLHDMGLVREFTRPDGTTGYAPTPALDDLNSDGRDTYIDQATSTNAAGGLEWVMESRITRVGGIAYTHDPAGNITSATIIAEHVPPTDWTHVRDVGPGVQARGTPQFTQSVADAHAATLGTNAGRMIASEIAASGRQVRIREEPDDGNSYGATHPEDRMAGAGGAHNRGTGGTVRYNPARTQAGDGTQPWHRRPPWIGYAHELAHARDAAQGAQVPGTGTDPGMPAGGTPADWQTNQREMQATSIGPFAAHASDENAIRNEAGLPRRDSYIL